MLNPDFYMQLNLSFKYDGIQGMNLHGCTYIKCVIFAFSTYKLYFNKEFLKAQNVGDGKAMEVYYFHFPKFSC